MTGPPDIAEVQAALDRAAYKGVHGTREERSGRFHMTIKIFTVAHVPSELAQAWLQHLRDFDTAHPGCHFEVMRDGPELALEQMVEALRINPGLTFTQFFERKKP